MRAMSQRGMETPIAPSISRPIQFSTDMVRAILAGTKTQTRRAIVPAPSAIRRIRNQRYPFCDDQPITCRFGEVGDQLWVRERWAMDDDHRVIYAADARANGQHRWRPSYMMPRSGSRIMLQITARRIERLANITRTDARSEGFPGNQLFSDPILWFRDLWDSLCKPEHAWKQNPWVWVIGFRVSSNNVQD